LIQRLSQRLREADDRIVNDKRRSGRAHGMRKDADSQTAVQSVNNAYLAAKTPWLQRQLHAPLGLGDLPLIVVVLGTCRGAQARSVPSASGRSSG
jgi:hypothetical protein